MYRIEFSRRAMMIAPLVIVVLFTLGGCASVQKAISQLDKPALRIDGVRLQDLTVDALTLEFDVEILNPYTFDLPLTNITYGLASGGSSFLDGSAALSGKVPARGAKTVTVPARVNFAELLAAVSGIRPGAIVPYAADFELAIDAPGLDELPLSVHKEGELPVPTVPSIALESVEWGELSFRKASATLAFRVTNTNDFPVDLGALDYALSLGGKRVADTRLRRGVSFDAGGDAVIEVPMSVKPIDLGLAVFEIFRGSQAGYELGGTMELSTPYGDLDLPFQQSGQTAFMR